VSWYDIFWKRVCLMETILGIQGLAGKVEIAVEYHVRDVYDKDLNGW